MYAEGISSKKKLARFERVQRVKDNIVGLGVIGGTGYTHWVLPRLVSLVAHGKLHCRELTYYVCSNLRAARYKTCSFPLPHGRADQRMRPRTDPPLLVERRKKSI